MACQPNTRRQTKDTLPSRFEGILHPSSCLVHVPPITVLVKVPVCRYSQKYFGIPYGGWVTKMMESELAIIGTLSAFSCLSVHANTGIRAVVRSTYEEPIQKLQYAIANPAQSY